MKMRNYYIEKVSATKHKIKRSIREPYLDVGKKQLVAMTDFSVAVVPIEVEENDSSGHIPVEIIVAARKRTVKNKTKHLNIDASDSALANYYKENEEVRTNIQKPNDVDKIVRYMGEKRHTVTINAERLMEIAKAINFKGGGSAVTLHLPIDNTGVIMVTPLNLDPYDDKNQAFGLLAPVLAGDAQND